ncbi:MAG: PQQ-binding-like beta-propeller repeat protein [Candidatus Bathyarchaeia archaeon]
MSKYSIKKLAIGITLLLLASTVSLMTNSLGNAQLASQQPISGTLPAGVTPSVTIKVKAYLSFRPNPVGLGQTFLVNIWTTPPVHPHRLHQNYKVTITKPDGTKDVITLNSYCADATAWFEYVADQVGTWKLKFEFPGEYYPAGQYYNGYIVTNTSGNWLDSAYYPPASTAEQELVVQDAKVLSWPPSELPTDYWTRPIHLENREWWPIAGNYPPYGIVGGGIDWPAKTNTYMSNYWYTPFVQAPNSAHIVWKRLGAIAGLIGGIAKIYGQTSSPGSPSVIYAGRAYQTWTKQGVGSVAACYDLRTGEIFYEIPTAQGGVTPQVISYGRSTSVAVPGATETNTYSVELISLSGNRLIKINPFSGAVTLNVTGMTPTTIGGGFDTGLGSFHNDPYVLSMQTLGSGANTKYCLINWTTAGTETNFTLRIVSNITLPWGPVSFPGGVLGYPAYAYDFETGVIVRMLGLAPAGAGIYYGTWLTAASLKTGQMLWNITVEDTRYSSSCIVADHGKVAVLMESGYWMAWDIYTGKLVWKSETMDYPWAEPGFGAYAVQSAYGLLYREAYDGVYAFDWDTGKIVWKYKAPTPCGYETPYVDENGVSVYSFNAGGIIADGKLYTYNTEHTPSWPRTRGWKLHCINATTGEGIWTLTGSMTPGAVADGYLVASNGDDGYMYVIGKGKSATSITASPKVSAYGTSVLIEGSVLDMSPAQPGTPCVSKESMTTQMEYLHMQLPIDGIWHNETITGVPVSLDALDPNGNYVHIGDVVTDGYSGTFGFTWTPEVPGQYKVTATFMGDDSYGSSFATTYVTVSEVPPASPTPSPPQAPPDYMPMMYAILLVGIIAIVISLISLFRKR